MPVRAALRLEVWVPRPPPQGMMRWGEATAPWPRPRAAGLPTVTYHEAIREHRQEEEDVLANEVMADGLLS